MKDAVKSKDRKRMADDLQRLALYAIANDVRAGRVTLSKGVNHVRDYCLPRVEQWISMRRDEEAESPPEPGTVGASMLFIQETRRDELRAFLDDWFAYDFPRKHLGGER